MLLPQILISFLSVPNLISSFLWHNKVASVDLSRGDWWGLIKTPGVSDWTNFCRLAKMLSTSQERLSLASKGWLRPAVYLPNLTLSRIAWLGMSGQMLVRSRPKSIRMHRQLFNRWLSMLGNTILFMNSWVMSVHTHKRLCIVCSLLHIPVGAQTRSVHEQGPYT